MIIVYILFLVIYLEEDYKKKKKKKKTLNCVYKSKDILGKIKNSKGTAHAQPFKIWPSCNLLALAFSLWMHGSNVSRICSLGCNYIFKSEFCPLMF